MIEVVLVPVGVKLLHDTGGLAVKSVPIYKCNANVL
jgi:hypothetical protein